MLFVRNRVRCIYAMPDLGKYYSEISCVRELCHAVQVLECINVITDVYIPCYTRVNVRESLCSREIGCPIERNIQWRYPTLRDGIP